MTELQDHIWRLLSGLYRKERDIDLFLRSPQAILDGAIPNDLIAAGESARIEHALERLDEEWKSSWQFRRKQSRVWCKSGAAPT